MGKRRSRSKRARWGSSKWKTGALVLLGTCLYAAASVGIADVAGFASVERRMAMVRWPWLLVDFAGVAVGLVAYTVAWLGIVDTADGPELSRLVRFMTATVGFGGFLFRGGSTVDRHVMQAAGVEKREIKVRLAALDGLEHAPLAIGCCALAIVSLARGWTDPPPLDYVWPWAVIPPVAAAIVIAATRWLRVKLQHRRGLLGWLGIALDSIYLLWQMVVQGKFRGRPYFAMTMYWVCELAALWAAMRAFGYEMPFPALIFAYVGAYVITRRPAPFGGAGPLDLLLPLSLWACGAPLAASVAGTIAFRFASLWLPFPMAIRGAAMLAKLSPQENEPEPALA
jgi:uncharacterized membrane protein YbhN (UPF0104 family)